MTPRLTDRQNGFAWPDTPVGVVEDGSSVDFYASDGGIHTTKNNLRIAGSVVRTVGSYDDPLGTEAPIDVVIEDSSGSAPDGPNPSYTYVGGGPVFRVPNGRLGQGQLLMVTHLEIATPDTKPLPSFYSLLGLSASSDNGFSWRFLGEILRLNLPYESAMAGVEIGDPPLVLTRDGSRLRIYYRDWTGGKSLHQAKVVNLAVIEAPLQEVVSAAFGFHPHAAEFKKFFNGTWSEPAISGRAQDIAPAGMFGEERQVTFNEKTGRYMMVFGSGTRIGYSDSTDGVNWRLPITISDFERQSHRIYISSPIFPKDRRMPDNKFFVFYTWLPTSSGGWNKAELRRLSVACQ